MYFPFIFPPVFISHNLFNLFVKSDSLAGAWWKGSGNSLVLYSQLMYLKVCIVEVVPGDTAAENNWYLPAVQIRWNFKNYSCKCIPVIKYTHGYVLMYRSFLLGLGQMVLKFIW